MKALQCPTYPTSSIITVKAGWIIDAIDVDGLWIGGTGGRKYITELGLKEKVTAIEYGYHHDEDGYWHTGSMCSFTIYINYDDYGPFGRHPRGCTDIQKMDVPSDMSFKQFMKKNAEETNDGRWSNLGVTIPRD